MHASRFGEILDAHRPWCLALRSPIRVRGGVVIEFGWVCHQNTYPYMYPACILKDTRILMYPGVSQTYLTCSVTFEENTCILTFCMYFDMYPKESQIHLGYMSDTSRYMYLARFLGVTLDTSRLAREMAVRPFPGTSFVRWLLCHNGSRRAWLARGDYLV